MPVRAPPFERASPPAARARAVVSLPRPSFAWLRAYLALRTALQAPVKELASRDSGASFSAKRSRPVPAEQKASAFPDLWSLLPLGGQAIA